jgi:nucleotide-binding universal stress UspA family protein
MPAPRHLVAATDFSEAAGHAVDRAFALAAAHGATLTIGHGLGLDGLTLLQGVLGPRLPEVAASLKDAASRRLTALASEASRPSAVRASTVVDVGAGSLVVDQLVRSQQADLLVVGARNGDLLHRVLMGSTASRLLRASPCPVLSVKQPMAGPYRRVLIGVGNGPDTERHVRIVRDLAPDAEVILLHALALPAADALREAGVTPEMFDTFRDEQIAAAAERLRGFAMRLGLPEVGTRTVVVTGDPARALLEHGESAGCDLLVLGRIDRGSPDALPVGSATRQVLAGSTADVLVIPDPPQG